MQTGKMAIQLNPSDEKANAYLALLLLVNGDHDSAVREGRAAIELKPNDASGHNSLGTALGFSGAGFYNEAMKQSNFPKPPCGIISPIPQPIDILSRHWLFPVRKRLPISTSTPCDWRWHRWGNIWRNAPNRRISHRHHKVFRGSNQILAVTYANPTQSDHPHLECPQLPQVMHPSTMRRSY